MSKCTRPRSRESGRYCHIHIGIQEALDKPKEDDPNVQPDRPVVSLLLALSNLHDYIQS